MKPTLTQKVILPILEEARNRHGDILYEPSWNRGYQVQLSLTVGELRRICRVAKISPVTLKPLK